MVQPCESRVVSVSSYEELSHWRRHLALYPPELDVAGSVVEQWWRWRGLDVHLDRIPAPRSRFVVILVHGAGGYGRVLAPFAGLIGVENAEVIAPDLPGYGLTRTEEPVDYRMWADCVADLVHSETQRSGRPVVLVGASMGGMVAYDVAATVGAAGLVATCLLDPRDRAVRRGIARLPWLGVAGPRLLNAAAPAADRLQVPIRWIADMAAVSNNPHLSSLVASDPAGGGNRVSLRFLRTFLDSTPRLEPEEFNACPVLLTHPAADTWTPVELSRPFFDRIAAPKELVMLDNAGHMPVEQPGLTQLRRALGRLLDQL